jgi:hypothetical protein
MEIGAKKPVGRRSATTGDARPSPLSSEEQAFLDKHKVKYQIRDAAFDVTKLDKAIEKFFGGTAGKQRWAGAAAFVNECGQAPYVFRLSVQSRTRLKVIIEGALREGKKLPGKYGGNDDLVAARSLLARSFEYPAGSRFIPI